MATRFLGQELRLRLLQCAAHAALVPAILYGDSAWWLATVIFYAIHQILGVAVALHRWMSHKAFEPSPTAKYILAVLAVLVGMGNPIAWAAIHRQHHGAADGLADPHSPHRQPSWRIVSGAWYGDVRVMPRLVADLLREPSLRFVSRHYFSILGAWLALLSILHWQAAVHVFFLPILLVYYNLNFGLILGHKWGYRNFATPDASVNSWVMSLVGFGEGWHNNHHHDPRSWNTRRRWWEFDIPALCIRWIFLREERGHVPLR